MRPQADLHIHSIFSDGTSTVDKICELAVKRGIRTIALSDHDTTGGLRPIQDAVLKENQAGHSLTLIPSIELSSGENGLAHVLGYGIREGMEPLESELAALKRIRVERNVETIRLLEKLLGRELMPVPLEESAEVNPVLGRMHVARLLIDYHIVQSVDEAFRKYLGVGKPAYLPLSHMTTEQAIRLLRSCGAVPVLAHPVRTGFLNGDADAELEKLKAFGLMGLEVFHPSASRPDVKRLAQLAKDHQQLVTGGSDYHGEWGTQSKIGEFPAGWHTWAEDLDRLHAAIAQASVT